MDKFIKYTIATTVASVGMIIAMAILINSLVIATFGASSILIINTMAVATYGYYEIKAEFGSQSL